MVANHIMHIICHLCLICFVRYSMVHSLYVILYMTKKWWKKHGDEFIEGIESTLYNAAKSFLRIICTSIYKLFQ